MRRSLVAKTLVLGTALMTFSGACLAVDSVSALRSAPIALVESSFERLVEFAFDGSYVLFVAESALDGPLGFCLMLDTLPDEVSGMPQGFIAYMAVDPNARRQGIARTLLAAADRFRTVV